MISPLVYACLLCYVTDSLLLTSDETIVQMTK